MRKTPNLCDDGARPGFIMRMKSLNSFFILTIFVIAIVLKVIFMPALALAIDLSALGNQLWHQDIPSIVDEAEAGDEFGMALTYGDFNGDGYADLAIGVPFEGIEGMERDGVVNVLYAAKISMPWIPLFLLDD